MMNTLISSGNRFHFGVSCPRSRRCGSEFRSTHEAHEDHEADSAHGGNNLFCFDLLLTKQIFMVAFWQKCLMLAHILHEFDYASLSSCQNMRLMRIYEDR